MRGARANGRDTPVPADSFSGRRSVVGTLERVAGQHAEAVGERGDIGCVGRVVAREVVDEAAADNVDVGEGAVRPLEVAAEERLSEAGRGRCEARTHS